MSLVLRPPVAGSVTACSSGIVLMMYCRKKTQDEVYNDTQKTLLTDSMKVNLIYTTIKTKSCQLYSFKVRTNQQENNPYLSP